jgi:glycine cleavage system H lipoate-binding protein
MSIQRLIGRQLYLPALHLWYRPTMSESVLSSACRIEIGMTNRGLEDLGDISHITKRKRMHDTVEKGDNLLSMDWDGHRITTADELYHTVWENISGTYSLNAPASGRIEYIIDGNDVDDEDEVLVTLSMDENSLQSILASLVSEEDYLQAVEKPGAFNEVEGMYR